ncbi:MAG: DUF1501 domain-containing protein [Anaerolineales bacterium]|nr:DUF1501 domain-containing protein [Anaerolineales bacterium]
MPVAISRRQFLRGCSTTIAAMAGARLTRLAFAASATANDEILVVVFLRGGWDALNVVPPLAGPDRALYEQARPNLRVAAAGPGAALSLDGQFGLHPSLAALYPLYQAQRLAVVHAVGLTTDTRSHFDAMQFMELGTPGVKTTATGWLTRHLQTAANLPPNVVFPALSAGGTTAMSLLGTADAVAMSSPSGFRLDGAWNLIDEQRAALRDLYTPGDLSDWLRRAGTETLDTIDLVEQSALGTYIPANGAQYPAGSFGDNLRAVAQLIKMDLGLQVATVDLGGWDTHEYQGDNAGGYLAERLQELALGLAALYTDLDGGCGQGYARRTTVVVMSEFGRRLRENANHGTDHGHGSAMFVLGGSVRGGHVYGGWPGLATGQLYDGYDLAVTTDYRRVLSDILTRRLGQPTANLSAIFPGYAGYTPLEIVADAFPPPLVPAGPHRVYLPTLTQGIGPSCP